MEKTEEEKAIIKRCRDICNRNNKEDSINLIKKEYPGCAVTITMDTYHGGMKQFMGMMMYKDFNISF